MIVVFAADLFELIAFHRAENIFYLEVVQNFVSKKNKGQRIGGE